MVVFVHMTRTLSAFTILPTTANFYLAAAVELKSLTIVMVESGSRGVAAGSSFSSMDSFTVSPLPCSYATLLYVT
jgi:hypothetical protein